MRRKRRVSLVKGLVFGLLGLFMLSGQCYAMEAFDNIPAPQGWYFITYPMYKTADKLKDGDGNTSVSNLDLAFSANLFRFGYYDKVFDHSCHLTFIAPVGRVEMLGDHDQGFGDFTVAAGYWFLDDPASKTWLGTICYADIPVGDYDSTKSANMGKNVWQFRPTIVFAKQFGKFDLELTGKYNVYTKNKDINTKAGQELGLESYLGYFIRPNLILGGHFNATFGQDKKVAGKDVPNSGVRKYQAGPSITWLNPACSIVFETLFDFGVENGPSAQTFLTRFSWKI